MRMVKQSYVTSLVTHLYNQYTVCAIQDRKEIQETYFVPILGKVCHCHCFDLALKIWSKYLNLCNYAKNLYGKFRAK